MASVILSAVLLLITLFLSVKIYLLRKAFAEITEGLDERLDASDATNTLISLSSRDKRARAFCAGINDRLKRLREERLRFSQGDRRLREAITNISHDLRTPLAAVRGYLDLLDAEEMSGRAREYISIIKNRSDAMGRMTDELFKYTLAASQDELKPEQVSLNSALEETLSSCYASLTAAGITPEVIMAEQGVVRMLDRDALARVLENIISNAVKYSSGDLKITLTGEGVMSFSNSAPGMTDIQAARLFDRFYTLETASPSTGLGLSIARTLTERMGGRIWAEGAQDRLTVALKF